MPAHSTANARVAAVLRPQGRPAAELQRWAAGTLVGLLCAATLLIAWRRLAGTITIALQPAWLLSVGGLVAVAAAGVRFMWRGIPVRAESSPEWPISLVTSAALLGLGAALSLPGTQPWALAVFWALLLGEELWAWRPAAWRSPSGGGPSRLLRHRGGRRGPDAGAMQPSAALTAGVPAADVLQQLTRSQAADGSEQLCGWLRASFAQGQRTATVHLAFCPQFARTPELTVQQHDGPEIQRINQTVFSFGARLDLKLAAAVAEPRDVVLGFSARSKPPAPALSTRPSTP